MHATAEKPNTAAKPADVGVFFKNADNHAKAADHMRALLVSGARELIEAVLTKAGLDCKTRAWRVVVVKTFERAKRNHPLLGNFLPKPVNPGRSDSPGHFEVRYMPARERHGYGWVLAVHVEREKMVSSVGHTLQAALNPAAAAAATVTSVQEACDRFERAYLELYEPDKLGAPAERAVTDEDRGLALDALLLLEETKTKATADTVALEMGDRQDIRHWKAVLDSMVAAGVVYRSGDEYRLIARPVRQAAAEPVVKEPAPAPGGNAAPPPALPSAPASSHAPDLVPLHEAAPAPRSTPAPITPSPAPTAVVTPPSPAPPAEVTDLAALEALVDRLTTADLPTVLATVQDIRGRRKAADAEVAAARAEVERLQGVIQVQTQLAAELRKNEVRALAVFDPDLLISLGQELKRSRAE